MKRIQLIAAALCLVMLTTVGAGAVAAKQEENPRQAGSSHIYFYDVTASDTHGKGKLQINVDTHTFVFNGQGFTPSAQIALRARATDSADYAVFASGKATPSGNLHIAGTWDKNAAPAEVAAGTYYTPIYTLWLRNYGWFVAQIACYYSTDNGATWTESGHTDGLTKKEGAFANLDTLGVPEGALVKIHVVVVGGKDRTGSEVFQYAHYVDAWQYTNYYASYEISGVTWNPKLSGGGVVAICPTC